jgi:hypothetical protein
VTEGVIRLQYQLLTETKGRKFHAMYEPEYVTSIPATERNIRRGRVNSDDSETFDAMVLDHASHLPSPSIRRFRLNLFFVLLLPR